MNQKHRSWLYAAGGIVLGVVLALSLPVSADKSNSPSLPLEEMRAFGEVYNIIKNKYVDDVDDKKVMTEAIKGMVSGLDPHSAFLTAEEHKQMREVNQGEFGGLGLEIGMDKGVVKVITPIDDTPAARAGIQPGDYIIRIDDTAVRGLSLEDAVKKMRGKPGTQVQLRIIRNVGEKSEPVVVNLVRAVIHTKSIKSKVLEPGYVLIRASIFQEGTVRDLIKEINDLNKKEPIRGIALDLRNNPGGLLDAAIGMSSIFLGPNKLVVYTDGRDPASKQKHYSMDYRAQLPANIEKIPLVVLVSNGSASASEIVAAAMQDYQRGAVLGKTTFGKASVQTMMPLSHGTAIKYTIARYFSPKGRSIQVKGVEPDQVVEDPDTPKDLEDFSLREGNYDKHLESKTPADAAADKTPEAPKVQPVEPPAKGYKPKAERSVLKPGELPGVEHDYVVARALERLKKPAK